MKYIFTFFLTILYVGISFSQCNKLTKAVKIAEKSFDEGDLENASSQLITVLNQEKSPCPVERRKAELLLAEVALFMNQDSIADIAFRSALRISPRYKVDTTLKSIDLYYFAQDYRTVPKFSIRPYIGINNYEFKNLQYFPTPTIEYLYNISQNQAQTLSAELGYSLGLQVGWHPTTFLEVGLGAAYNIKNIEIQKSIGIKELVLLENQSWVTIPALVKINLAHQDFIPKIIIGAEYSYLINAVLSDASNGNIKRDDHKININELRNKHHYSYVLGIGSDFRLSRINRNYFSFEIKYSNQRTALVNAENRYNHPGALFGLGYVDNDIPIGVHHLEVSLGLSITKYRVQKIKK
jgi:hypothetical protein